MKCKGCKGLKRDTLVSDHAPKEYHRRVTEELEAGSEDPSVARRGLRPNKNWEVFVWGCACVKQSVNCYYIR